MGQRNCGGEPCCPLTLVVNQCFRDAKVSNGGAVVAFHIDWDYLMPNCSLILLHVLQFPEIKGRIEITDITEL